MQPTSTGRAAPAQASSTQSPPARGYLLLAALILFWGLNFPVMKVILDQLEPWTFRTLCLLVGGVGLLTICRLNGQSLAVPASDRRILVIAALFNITGWHLASAFGVSLMQAGRSIILAYTMPLWASLLGVWVLGERLTGRRALGLILAVGGILVLLWPDRASLLKAPQGVLFMLLAAWCWATGTVLIKRGPWHISLFLVTGWMFLIGGIPVVIGMLLWGSPSQLLHMDTNAWLLTTYSIGLPIMFCHWGYYKLVSIFPVSLAALGMLGAPMVGVITAAWFLGESLGWAELVSLGLVIPALALVLINPAGPRHKAG